MKDDQPTAKAEVNRLVQVHFWMTLGLTTMIAMLSRFEPSGSFDLVLVMMVILFVLSLPYLFFVYFLLLGFGFDTVSLGSMWISHALFFVILVVMVRVNSFIAVVHVPMISRSLFASLKRLLPLRERE